MLHAGIHVGRKGLQMSEERKILIMTSIIKNAYLSIISYWHRSDSLHLGLYLNSFNNNYNLHMYIQPNAYVPTNYRVVSLSKVTIQDSELKMFISYLLFMCKSSCKNFQFAYTHIFMLIVLIHCVCLWERLNFSYNIFCMKFQ